MYHAFIPKVQGFSHGLERDAYPHAYSDIRMYRCKEAKGKNNIKHPVPSFPHHACRLIRPTVYIQPYFSVDVT
jgi:hypothetical protein